MMMPFSVQCCEVNVPELEDSVKNVLVDIDVVDSAVRDGFFNSCYDSFPKNKVVAEVVEMPFM